MKATTLLFTFLFFANMVLAQFGITGRYHINNAPDWIVERSNGISEKLLANNYSIGIDYWFRLKNYRIEFLPEIYLSSKSEVIISDGSAFNTYFYGLNLNTNFYLFDFRGDCDCPTFSKQGKALQKGVFVQLSPGFGFFDNQVDPFNEGASGDVSTTFSLGSGLGIDVGISDFLTFSPIIGIRYFIPTNWSTLLAVNDSSQSSIIKKSESSITQFSIGARLGVRLDYQSNRRRR